KDVSADLVDGQIQVGTVRELALGAQVPVKKMLCDRTHRQVRIIGGSNSICLEGMEKVPFVSSRGLLTTVSFGDNDTSQRILVSVHQVNVTEASKSSLVGDSLPLLSGRQKGGRVQLGRSPPVGVGDRSAPVVLAEFNRSLDISTGSADAGQHKSSCYWNTVRSSRVGEIHKRLVEAVGGSTSPLTNTQISLSIIDIKSTRSVESRAVARTTRTDRAISSSSVSNSDHRVPLRVSQIVCAIQ